MSRKTMQTDDVRITREGRRDLVAQAGKLQHETIPRLDEMREGSGRDPSVLADYERATAELARIRELLATAGPVEALPDDPEIVELGETVTVRLADGTSERYVIVHPSEAIVGSGRTSSLSPLGLALLGGRVGDEVEVVAPGGSYRCVIESATRSTDPSHHP